MLVVAGNAPAAELRQRLAAEARPAGAEKDQRAGALAELAAARRGRRAMSSRHSGTRNSGSVASA